MFILLLTYQEYVTISSMSRIKNICCGPEYERRIFKKWDGPWVYIYQCVLRKQWKKKFQLQPRFVLYHLLSVHPILKKKRPRKKIKKSETETPPSSIAKHCKDKQKWKIFSRRGRKVGMKTKVKIELSQISLKFKVNDIWVIELPAFNLESVEVSVTPSRPSALKERSSVPINGLTFKKDIRREVYITISIAIKGCPSTT